MILVLYPFMLTQSLDPMTSQTLDQRPDLTVTLAPTTAQHLLMTLDTLAALKFDCEALQHQIDIEKLTIQSILSEAGEERGMIGQYSLSMVGGTSSRLDPAKLMAQGVTLKQIEKATVKTAKKKYLLVSGTDHGTTR